jgi:hypothetical protein
MSSENGTIADVAMALLDVTVLEMHGRELIAPGR